MKAIGGHSMTGRLRRVLVQSPAAAGWKRGRSRWQELGFLRNPDPELAQRQHEQLVSLLRDSEVEVVELPGPSPSLDAVYVHDASFPTDGGALILNPGKRNRADEAESHARFYLATDTPVLGRLESPATAEGGDMVWIDDETLLIGRSYRTNDAGIDAVTDLLRPSRVEVVSAPLPHGLGPDVCLHLMSVMSPLDDRRILVDSPWLAVETMEWLQERGFELLTIDERERETLSCNVLSVGEGRLIALAENAATNDRLRRAGFDVRTFEGSEVAINGSGGPTCLTRPLLRE